MPSTETGRLEEVWETFSNEVCASVYHVGYLYSFDLRDVQSKPFRPSRRRFSLARRTWQRKRGSAPLGELLFRSAEWSGFYAAAVAILLWRS